MASSSAAEPAPTPSARVRPSPDPGWDYGQPENGDRNSVKCDFCQGVSKGGIHRHKLHLIGGNRDVVPCKKVTADVKERIKNYMAEVSKKKKESQRIKELNMGLGNINVYESGSNAVLDSRILEDDAPPSTPGSTSVSNTHLLSKHKGPLDAMFPPNFDNLVQKPIDNVHRKVARENTCEFICDFIYENGISFNVVKSGSFTRMLAAVGQFGPNLKGPTYHEVRVPFLKKKVGAIQGWIDDFKVHWKNYGCTIMCDWWTDGKRRTLINFLVNCPKGTVFLKSIDGSDQVKTGMLCYDMLVKVINEVGVGNVVQIITDNASNLKQAGGWIEDELNIFWTPCAAHCLNLMCEDISTIKKFNDVVVKCRTVTRYIYNHLNVLAMMRKFTSNRDLTRPASTRFATCFLAMDSILNVKAGLRGMMISEEWTNSTWARDFDGRLVSKILKKSKFWNDLHFCVQVYKPIVDVIRLVDKEEKPSMGYIYLAVDQMIKQLPLVLSDPKDSVILDKVLKIVRERWSEQLHRPLHAAGYYLNPSIYFADENSGIAIEGNADIKRGMQSAMLMLNQSMEDQDKISTQLLVYRSGGLLSVPLAKRNIKTLSPVEWWVSWGAEVPELQRFAKRVLGLTNSASPCERNWSAFNNLHTKKRNRLDHQKLNDLVYVSYNTKLRARYLDRTSLAGKDTDPLILQDYETACEEWLAPIDADDDETEEEDGAHTTTRQYKKNAATERRDRRSPVSEKERWEEQFYGYSDEMDDEDGAHTTTRQHKKNPSKNASKNPSKNASKKVRVVDEIYKSNTIIPDDETLSTTLQRRKRKIVSSDSDEGLESLDDVPLRCLQKKKQKAKAIEESSDSLGDDDFINDGSGPSVAGGSGPSGAVGAGGSGAGGMQEAPPTDLDDVDLFV